MAQVNEAHRESGERPLVFSSIVDDAVRSEINKADGLVLDVFERFIVPLEAELGVKSMHAVGRTHSVGNAKDYNHRIEAINYTLAHDDGVTHRGLEEADIVLVGVSRSGKTPTCLYMAMQFGIKAANYPLIPEDLEANRLPPSLGPAQAEGVGPVDHARAPAPDPQRAPPGLALRRARQLPLRGVRRREAHAPGADPLPRLDHQVHRGDRDAHAARGAPGAARLLRKGLTPFPSNQTFV